MATGRKGGVGMGMGEGGWGWGARKMTSLGCSL